MILIYDCLYITDIYLIFIIFYYVIYLLHSYFFFIFVFFIQLSKNMKCACIFILEPCFLNILYRLNLWSVMLKTLTLLSKPFFYDHIAKFIQLSILFWTVFCWKLLDSSIEHWVELYIYIYISASGIICDTSMPGWLPMLIMGIS